MTKLAAAKEVATQFLALLDRNAAVADYLKYLPDGDFEQWSYPEIEIKNIDHLKQFFAQAWGMIKTQKNEVTNLVASEIGQGRVQVDVDVNWSAETAAGQKLSRSLHYCLVIADGVAAGDPTGAYPKIMRYKMTRP